MASLDDLPIPRKAIIWISPQSALDVSACPEARVEDCCLWRHTASPVDRQNVAFNLLCVCRIQYGAPLEQVTFQFSTADFVYMLMFGMASTLRIQTLRYFMER